MLEGSSVLISANGRVMPLSKLTGSRLDRAAASFSKVELLTWAFATSGHLARTRNPPHRETCGSCALYGSRGAPRVFPAPRVTPDKPRSSVLLLFGQIGTLILQAEERPSSFASFLGSARPLEMKLTCGNQTRVEVSNEHSKSKRGVAWSRNDRQKSD